MGPRTFSNLDTHLSPISIFGITGNSRMCLGRLPGIMGKIWILKLVRFEF